MNTASNEKVIPRIGDYILLFNKNENPVEAQIVLLGDICTLLLDKEDSLKNRFFYLPYNQLYNIKREYKVINLTVFTDQKNQKKYLEAELTHVKKKFSVEENNIKCHFSYSYSETEFFILPLSSELAQQLFNNPEETVLICHKMFFIEKDYYKNGKTIKASYIFHSDFLSPGKSSFLIKNNHLFTNKINNKFELQENSNENKALHKCPIFEK